MPDQLFFQLIATPALVVIKVDFDTLNRVGFVAVYQVFADLKRNIPLENIGLQQARHHDFEVFVF